MRVGKSWVQISMPAKDFSHKITAMQRFGPRAFKVFLFQMESKDQFYLIDIIWATEAHSTDFFIYLISVKDCTPSAFYEPNDVQ